MLARRAGPPLQMAVAMITGRYTAFLVVRHAGPFLKAAGVSSLQAVLLRHAASMMARESGCVRWISVRCKRHGLNSSSGLGRRSSWKSRIPLRIFQRAAVVH